MPTLGASAKHKRHSQEVKHAVHSLRLFIIARIASHTTAPELVFLAPIHEAESAAPRASQAVP